MQGAVDLLRDVVNEIRGRFGSILDLGAFLQDLQNVIVATLESMEGSLWGLNGVILCTLLGLTISHGLLWWELRRLKAENAVMTDPSAVVSSKPEKADPSSVGSSATVATQCPSSMVKPTAPSLSTSAPSWRRRSRESSPASSAPRRSRGSSPSSPSSSVPPPLRLVSPSVQAWRPRWASTSGPRPWAPPPAPPMPSWARPRSLSPPLWRGPSGVRFSRAGPSSPRAPSSSPALQGGNFLYHNQSTIRRRATESSSSSSGASSSGNTVRALDRSGEADEARVGDQGQVQPLQGDEHQQGVQQGGQGRQGVSVLWALRPSQWR